MNEFPVSWTALGIILSAIGVSGGALIAALLWVYRELNSLRESQSDFKVEVAKSYVSIIALRSLEERFENNINRLADRIDKSLTSHLRLNNRMIKELNDEDE
jgi:hypothetical protein